MQRVAKSAWLWMLAACVAALMAVLLLPTPAHAEGTSVSLDASLNAKGQNSSTTQTGGSVTPSSIVLEDSDTLPALPNPTPPTGWNFVGWYTSSIDYIWWDDPNGFSHEVALPAGYEKNPATGQNYTFQNDFWTWLAKTDGKRVSAGETLEGGVTTLYALYEPKTVTVNFHWNGWENKWGALVVNRDYGTSTSGVVHNSWTGHTFEGWYTSPKAGEGTYYQVNNPVTYDTPKDLYAHYSGMAADPETQHGSMIAAWSVKVSPSSATIASNGDKVTLTAALTMMSSTSRPTANDWNHVNWEVVGDGASLVDLSATTGLSCTVTSRGQNSGTVKVQAWFLNEKAQKVTSTATIDVKAHVHTYGKETVLVAPTCQRDGYGNKTCTICGETVRVDYPKVDHTYKTEVKDATCTAAGYEKTLCTVCGYVKQTKDVAATGHKYTEKTISSCTGDVVTKTCTTCGHTEQTQGTGQGQHQWQTDYTVDKPATCGHAGSKSIHCAKCSATKNSTEIPKNDNHTWGGWHTTKPATTDAKGMQERTCSTCGKTETQELPALVTGTTPDDPQNPEQPSQPDDPQDPEQPDQPENPGAGDEPSDEPSDEPGANVSPAPLPERGPTEAVRILNPFTGEHLFVPQNEANVRASEGWTVEGRANTPAKSNTPVYRLYNQYTGEHHYTTSTDEYTQLEAAGWTGEGVQFYSDDNKAVKVYRLWDGTDRVGSHLYTQDLNEYRTLVAQGWQPEEGGWYYAA